LKEGTRGRKPPHNRGRGAEGSAGSAGSAEHGDFVLLGPISAISKAMW
jgi:hypothetical protein